MNFWKEHSPLRSILIALFILVGLALTVIGWMQDGGALGMGLMAAGVACLLWAFLVCFALRGFLIALFFVIGMVLTIVGWKMTGELKGLGIMLAGVVCLLTALFVYNKPYSGKSR